MDKYMNFITPNDSTVCFDNKTMIVRDKNGNITTQLSDYSAIQYINGIPIKDKQFNGGAYVLEETERGPPVIIIDPHALYPNIMIGNFNDDEFDDE